MESECDKWLRNFYSNIPYEQYSLLDRAARILEANSGGFREEQQFPWSPLRGIMPSIAGFRGVWNWDCAFHAMTCSRWNPELAKDQFRIFINLQKDSGLFPDVLRENGELVDRFGKPPVMPWAALEVYKRSSDIDFLQVCYNSFVKSDNFWSTERGGNLTGLFYYDSDGSDPELRLKEARFESGWDNSVRWDNSVWDIWPIDLNCYIYMMYVSMSKMAVILNLQNDAIHYQSRADDIADKIECRLWNEEQKCYMDYDFKKKCFTNVITPASFMPLFAGFADKLRAKDMASIAMEHFNPGWPSVSHKAHQFNEKSYWRGRCWLNIAYFALKGLKNYGFTEIAENGKETILGFVKRDPGTIYENYNPVTGYPLGVPSFGWSAAFVIEFILNW